MKYLNYKKYERKRGLEAASSIHCMVMGSTRSPKISKLGFQKEFDRTWVYHAPRLYQSLKSICSWKPLSGYKKQKISGFSCWWSWVRWVAWRATITRSFWTRDLGWWSSSASTCNQVWWGDWPWIAKVFYGMACWKMSFQNISTRHSIPIKSFNFGMEFKNLLWK